MIDLETARTRIRARISAGETDLAIEQAKAREEHGKRFTRLKRAVETDLPEELLPYTFVTEGDSRSDQAWLDICFDYCTPLVVRYQWCAGCWVRSSWTDLGQIWAVRRRINSPVSEWYYTSSLERALAMAARSGAEYLSEQERTVVQLSAWERLRGWFGFSPWL